MRRLARLAAAVLAALAGAETSAHGAEPALEYRVKAAFLYKFGSYVEWPPAALPRPPAPITLCVVGKDPFGVMLDRTVVGQTVAGRALAVRRVAALSAESGCHIAYLGGGAGQSVAEAMRIAADMPVLTVTDGASSNARGVIHFMVVSNRVRFAINQKRAAQNGLTISSNLLKLAVEVAR